MELEDITKEAVIVGPEATLEDVVRKMITEQANALIVIDDEGKFAGEINVSDLFEAIVPEQLDGDDMMTYFSSEEKFIEAVQNAKGKPVTEFTTLNADPVLVTDSIMNVAAAALAHQHSRIPIVDHSNRPIGVISRRGLKHIIGNFMGIETS